MAAACDKESNNDRGTRAAHGLMQSVARVELRQQVQGGALTRGPRYRRDHTPAACARRPWGRRSGGRCWATCGDGVRERGQGALCGIKKVVAAGAGAGAAATRGLSRRRRRTPERVGGGATTGACAALGSGGCGRSARAAAVARAQPCERRESSVWKKIQWQ